MKMNTESPLAQVRKRIDDLPDFKKLAFAALICERLFPHYLQWDTKTNEDWCNGDLVSPPNPALLSLCLRASVVRSLSSARYISRSTSSSSRRRRSASKTGAGRESARRRASAALRPGR